MESSAKSKPVSIKDVSIRDDFWSYYVDLVRNTIIPYQWEALNDRVEDAAPSHAVKNFRIAAGLEEGEFYGCVFQDSDVAKWLEAVAYSLEKHPDTELERTADEMIDIIEKAQQPDGYLNTYFTIKEPEKRWTNLYECHELYCAGHMIEAAVAYYNATGKRKLMDVMCRFVDYIDSMFGPEPGKLKGYPGHQEIELALVKLYKATGNEKYLKLSKFFIDERGSQPNYFTQEWEEKRNKLSHWTKREVPAPDLQYNQSHLPVRHQEVAVGHAVRAVYMYTGMADIAAETEDRELYLACRRLWDNIIRKQMYITGGIGSTHHGEAFSFDYDLPNDTVYAETCASIGLIFFAHRMQQMDADGIYADVMEKILYNLVLSSLSRDGRSFFYVNPLEVWPDACDKNPGKHHVKPQRQKWFGCACCPPNIARLLASLGQYIYSVKDDVLYTHLYIAGEAEMEIGDQKVKIIQDSQYPWNEKVSFQIASDISKAFTIALRIPGWCKAWKVKVNGESVDPGGKIVQGYAMVEGNWKIGDRIELELSMPVEIMQANPKVRANAGKIALQRGPIIYCFEQIDNGTNLSALSLVLKEELAAEHDESLLGGVVAIKGRAIRTEESDWKDDLYRTFREGYEKMEDILAIPYYLWGNRGLGEMQVWIRQR